MFNLPPSTAISKPLYKKAIFEKFTLKTAERERFDADISRMTIVAHISPATLPALAKGKDTKGFYVLQVELKRREYDGRNILLLQKLIPQQMVFAMQYEGQTQLCVFHTRLLLSPWRPSGEVELPLRGLSLDEVWLHLVATVGDLDSEAEATLEEQIVGRGQRERLLQQIAQLEKRCRAERQPHRRYELHQQIVKLKEKWEGKV